jgi:RES domain-containing protein
MEQVLAPPGPDSAGRYHRHGQPALYFTAEADWAVIAVGVYMAEDGHKRFVVPLEVGMAHVFDQQDVAACHALGIDRERSQTRWRLAIDQGQEPTSWVNSDAARAIGADGIIDRSRGITGGWHVTLFRWNDLGGPKVEIAGSPIEIRYEDARNRWPHPPGWTLPVQGTRHA